MKNKLFKSALAVSLAFAMTLSSPVLAAESSAADSQIVETETNTPETSKTEGEAQTDKPSTPESESQNEKPSTPESESQNEKPSTPESESQNDKPSTPESESQNDKPSTPESESQDEKPLTPEKDSTEAFVARLYDTLLLRPADEQGLLEWTALLENHKATGADIIKGFIESDEFKAQNYSDEDYITVLYHALFDRTPDNTGLSQWLAVLDAHLSRNYVCHGFIGSDEFRALCKKYNILPGKLDVSGILDENPDTTKFVYRLYKLVLSRDADDAGLKAWVEALVSKRNNAAKVVEGFIFSDEFKKKNLNDSDYIEVLYKTLLDRNSDPEGKENWLEVAAIGVSRAFLLNDFIGSDEFTKLCAKYGITRGSLTLTENRDKNKLTTEYVSLVFKRSLDRTATVSDLNTWTGKLNNRTASARDFVYSIIFSDEAKPLIASDTDFINRLYNAALFRSPSDSELSSWLTALKTQSKTSVFNDITFSDEFSKLCKKWGVPNYTNGWNQSPEGMYYVKNGKVLTGWQVINGVKYYLDPSKGGVRANGWAYVDGYKLYFNDGILNQNVDHVIGKQSHYVVKVNTYTNTVTAYAKDGANGYIIPVKTMICSTGTSSTPTIKGTFTIRRYARWGTLMGPVYGQYCSQIYGGYLFHSAWYYVNGNNRTLSVYEYSKLGNNASHGCVRMTVADAKWIYDNCNGSTVTVYSSTDKGPFAKPARPNPVRISGDYGYDPTDPAFN